MSCGRPVIPLVVVVAAILAAAALAALCMFAWLVLADPFGGGSHPSDAALLAQFGAKRNLLDEFVHMIEADPRSSVWRPISCGPRALTWRESRPTG
jgi:hypothetical protein